MSGECKFPNNFKLSNASEYKRQLQINNEIMKKLKMKYANGKSDNTVFLNKTITKPRKRHKSNKTLYGHNTINKSNNYGCLEEDVSIQSKASLNLIPKKFKLIDSSVSDDANSGVLFNAYEQLEFNFDAGDKKKCKKLHSQLPVRCIKENQFEQEALLNTPEEIITKAKTKNIHKQKVKKSLYGNAVENENIGVVTNAIEHPEFHGANEKKKKFEKAYSQSSVDCTKDEHVQQQVALNRGNGSGRKDENTEELINTLEQLEFNCVTRKKKKCKKLKQFQQETLNSGAEIILPIEKTESTNKLKVAKSFYSNEGENSAVITNPWELSECYSVIGKKKKSKKHNRVEQEVTFNSPEDVLESSDNLLEDEKHKKISNKKGGKAFWSNKDDDKKQEAISDFLQWLKLYRVTEKKKKCKKLHTQLSLETINENESTLNTNKDIMVQLDNMLEAEKSKNIINVKSSDRDDYEITNAMEQLEFHDTGKNKKSKRKCSQSSVKCTKEKQVKPKMLNAVEEIMVPSKKTNKHNHVEQEVTFNSPEDVLESSDNLLEDEKHKKISNKKGGKAFWSNKDDDKKQEAISDFLQWLKLYSVTEKKKKCKKLHTQLSLETINENESTLNTNKDIMVQLDNILEAEKSKNIINVKSSDRDDYEITNAMEQLEFHDTGKNKKLKRKCSQSSVKCTKEKQVKPKMLNAVEEINVPSKKSNKHKHVEQEVTFNSPEDVLESSDNLLEDEKHKKISNKKGGKAFWSNKDDDKKQEAISDFLQWLKLYCVTEKKKKCKKLHTQLSLETINENESTLNTNKDIMVQLDNILEAEKSKNIINVKSSDRDDYEITNAMEQLEFHDTGKNKKSKRKCSQSSVKCTKEKQIKPKMLNTDEEIMVPLINHLAGEKIKINNAKHIAHCSSEVEDENYGVITEVMEQLEIGKKKKSKKLHSQSVHNSKKKQVQDVTAQEIMVSSDNILGAEKIKYNNKFDGKDIATGNLKKSKKKIHKDFSVKCTKERHDQQEEILNLVEEIMTPDQFLEVEKRKPNDSILSSRNEDVGVITHGLEQLEFHIASEKKLRNIHAKMSSKCTKGMPEQFPSGTEKKKPKKIRSQLSIKCTKENIEQELTLNLHEEIMVPLEDQNNRVVMNSLDQHDFITEKRRKSKKKVHSEFPVKFTKGESFQRELALESIEEITAPTDDLLEADKTQNISKSKDSMLYSSNEGDGQNSELITKSLEELEFLSATDKKKKSKKLHSQLSVKSTKAIEQEVTLNSPEEIIVPLENLEPEKISMSSYRNYGEDENCGVMMNASESTLPILLHTNTSNSGHSKIVKQRYNCGAKNNICKETFTYEEFPKTPTSEGCRRKERSNTFYKNEDITPGSLTSMPINMENVSKEYEENYQNKSELKELISYKSLYSLEALTEKKSFLDVGNIVDAENNDTIYRNNANYPKIIADKQKRLIKKRNYLVKDDKYIDTITNKKIKDMPNKDIRGKEIQEVKKPLMLFTTQIVIPQIIEGRRREHIISESFKSLNHVIPTKMQNISMGHMGSHQNKSEATGLINYKPYKPVTDLVQNDKTQKQFLVSAGEISIHHLSVAKTKDIENNIDEIFEDKRNTVDNVKKCHGTYEDFIEPLTDSSEECIDKELKKTQKHLVYISEERRQNGETKTNTSFNNEHITVSRVFKPLDIQVVSNNSNSFSIEQNKTGEKNRESMELIDHNPLKPVTHSNTITVTALVHAEQSQKQLHISEPKREKRGLSVGKLDDVDAIFEDSYKGNIVSSCSKEIAQEQERKEIPTVKKSPLSDSRLDIKSNDHSMKIEKVLIEHVETHENNKETKELINYKPAEHIQDKYLLQAHEDLCINLAEKHESIIESSVAEAMCRDWDESVSGNENEYSFIKNDQPSKIEITEKESRDNIPSKNLKQLKNKKTLGSNESKLTGEKSKKSSPKKIIKRVKLNEKLPRKASAKTKNNILEENANRGVLKHKLLKSALKTSTQKGKKTNLLTEKKQMLHEISENFQLISDINEADAHVSTNVVKDCENTDRKTNKKTKKSNQKRETNKKNPLAKNASGRKRKSLSHFENDAGISKKPKLTDIQEITTKVSLELNKPKVKDLQKNQKTLLNFFNVVQKNSSNESIVKENEIEQPPAENRKVTNSLLLDENKRTYCSSIEQHRIDSPNMINALTKFDVILKGENSDSAVYEIFKNLSEKAGRKLENIKCVSFNSNSPHTMQDLKIVNGLLSRDGNNTDFRMWTEKYKPTTSQEIVGNEESVIALKNWLNDWVEYNKMRMTKMKPQFDGDRCQIPYNTIVIRGHLGSGKCMTVNAICQEFDISVIEINASSKETGNTLLQEFKEATQSQSVFQKNKNKMCLLLIDDSDILLTQDQGFIRSLKVLTKISKQPIVLTTNNDYTNEVNKFYAAFPILQFEPLSANTFAPWLQIVCLLEGLHVDKNSLGQLLERNKGDVRLTLLQLQFWVQSTRMVTNFQQDPGKNDDFENESTYPLKTCASKTIIPFPINLNIIKDQKKGHGDLIMPENKRKTSDDSRELFQLERVGDGDSLAFSDVLEKSTEDIAKTCGLISDINEADTHVSNVVKDGENTDETKNKKTKTSNKNSETNKENPFEKNASGRKRKTLSQFENDAGKSKKPNLTDIQEITTEMSLELNKPKVKDLQKNQKTLLNFYNVVQKKSSNENIVQENKIEQTPAEKRKVTNSLLLDESKKTYCKNIDQHRIDSPNMINALTKFDVVLKGENSDSAVYEIFKNLSEKAGRKLESIKCVSFKSNSPHRMQDMKIVNELLSRDVNNTDFRIWTEKYKPTTSQEIVGNEESVVALKKWLNDWVEYNKMRMTKPKPQFDGDTCQIPHNTIVIRGHLGSGKCMTVNAICQELGISVIEINASSKRTGKSLKQFKEATQSQPVYQKNKNGNVKNKMCLLLIDDVDIEFTQDQGFIRALKRMIKKSKQPIVLTTNNDDTNEVKKFYTVFPILQFEPLSANSFAPWLQIVCLLEGLHVDKNSLGQLLERNKGDARRTLLQLQFWVQSTRMVTNFQQDQGKNYDFENECIEQPLITCASETIIPFPINLNILWWNMPDIFKHILNDQKKGHGDLIISENKRKTPDHSRELFQLESVGDLLDSLAISDVLEKCTEDFTRSHGFCSEPWEAEYKEGLTLSENMDNFKATQILNENMAHYLVEGYTRLANPNMNVSINMEVPTPSERRRISKQLDCHRKFMKDLPPTSALSRSAFAADYFPYLRNICRTESVTTNNKKKGIIKYNYLKSLNFTMKDSVIKTACDIMKL